MSKNQCLIKWTDLERANIVINDVEFAECATGLKVDMSPGNMPELDIELVTVPWIELEDADIRFTIADPTVFDAVKVVYYEVRNDDCDLRNGIKNILVEALQTWSFPFEPEEELAEHIIDYVFSIGRPLCYDERSVKYVPELDKLTPELDEWE